jgi:hypothetical protein
MSGTMRFYKHQIKPEYHDDRAFNTGLEHDPEGRLLGTLWLTHTGGTEDEPVDADSFFDPMIQSELLRMLNYYYVIPLLENVSFYVDATRSWNVGVLNSALWAQDTDFDNALHCVLDNLRDGAYAAASRGAPQDVVETMYRTYFTLEAYYNKNTEDC